MRESINEAIASTVTDMLEADLKVSFTQKELKKMGAKVVSPTLGVEEISHIRKRLLLIPIALRGNVFTLF